MQNFQLEEMRELRNNLLAACGHLQEVLNIIAGVDLPRKIVDEADAWEKNVNDFLHRVIGKPTGEQK